MPPEEGTELGAAQGSGIVLFGENGRYSGSAASPGGHGRECGAHAGYWEAFFRRWSDPGKASWRGDFVQCPEHTLASVQPWTAQAAALGDLAGPF